MRTIPKLLGMTLGVVLLVLGGIALKVTHESREGPGNLAIRWEGAVNDRNARDLGESLNDCLGEPFFKEGAVHRAAQWFSGWSCSGVGNPDLILSLNHRPTENERYYCRKENGNLVGWMSGAPEELNNIEFIETWSDPVMRASACWYFKTGLEAIGRGERLLVHCDAGRDRTGTYAAVLAALAAEATGPLDERILEAIECDYRKSSSLSSSKYGRMRRFLEQLAKRGGVGTFLAETCDIAPEQSRAAGWALRASEIM